MTNDEQVREAQEIAALIRAGKPVPCGKGPADEYLLALDDALRSRDEKIEVLKNALVNPSLHWRQQWEIQAKMCERAEAERIEWVKRGEASEGRAETLAAQFEEAKRWIASISKALGASDNPALALVQADALSAQIEAMREALDLAKTLKKYSQTPTDEANWAQWYRDREKIDSGCASHLVELAKWQKDVTDAARATDEDSEAHNLGCSILDDQLPVRARKCDCRLGKALFRKPQPPQEGCQ